ncbi:TPA: glycosyltransferase family 9 protein [Morganella morganii subsp. morganii]|uniref:Glycosyltransferase family 9 protein n=1 Tax=Morganella morganii TaxID=582 RepID=A0AAU8ZRW0_MORMO|nr:glycosyltransferase family 9 protein [Morganella morganii]HDU8691465.1 glycosyltransferase family 9 protein [Morganella morganii subsp. morganii]AWC95459.1 glycosyltransferase family 9 protein [Morganella morganii]EKW8486273.1 glycosyltransferase family 9 protein [Morganella morganii]HAT3624903.1 glycosyltransferase family 9 protein [Morganella morganii]HCU0878629.1 glycosyltransferase family 9 protein [Morganella morganii]
MSKKLKHKLVNLFLQLYTRRRDFSHSVTAFKQLETIDFRNIVIYSTTALGDFLMNTPAIHEVRKRFPDARITVVSGNKMAPYIRTGIGKDWDDVVCWNSKVHTVLKLVRDLKAHGTPDLILIMHSHNPYDYLSAVMTGAPFVFRCNHSASPCALIEPWLTNFSGYGHRHSVQARLDLITPLGCRFTDKSVEMHVPCDVTKVPSSVKRVGFQMGASSEERRWPVANFVILTRYLLTRYSDLNIVLVGAPNEIHLSDEFFSLLEPEFHNRIEPLIGKTTIEELTQVINNLDLLVTNDTGTMHLAFALKIPSISLHVSTYPQFTGPYQNYELHEVVSGFASKLLRNEGEHEMSAISVDSVIEATIKSLSAQGIMPQNNPE